MPRRMKHCTKCQAKFMVQLQTSSMNTEDVTTANSYCPSCRRRPHRPESNTDTKEKNNNATSTLPTSSPRMITDSCFDSGEGETIGTSNPTTTTTTTTTIHTTRILSNDKNDDVKQFPPQSTTTNSNARRLEELEDPTPPYDEKDDGTTTGDEKKDEQDNDYDDEGDDGEHGSEAGDDIHCTQLVWMDDDNEQDRENGIICIDDDDDDIDDEDDELALTELVARRTTMSQSKSTTSPSSPKRFHLDVQPVAISSSSSSSSSSPFSFVSPNNNPLEQAATSTTTTMKKDAVVIDLVQDDDDDDDDEDEGHSSTMNNKDVASRINQIPPTSGSNAALDPTTSTTMISSSSSSCTATEEEMIILKGSSMTAAAAAANNPDQKNETLAICPTCGAALGQTIPTWKGRVNHVKRCSKKHGVSANDIRIRLEEEEEEQLRQEEHYSDRVHSEPGMTITTTSNAVDSQNTRIVASSTKLSNNPYRNTKLQSKITTSRQSSSSPTPSKQATTNHPDDSASKNNANQKKNRPSAPMSVMDVLMQGAKQAAAADRKKRKRSAPLFIPQSASSSGTTTQPGPASNDRRPYPSTNQPRRRRGARGIGGGGGTFGKKNHYCPAYKRITGTDFVVDGFHYAQSSLTQNFFLTHFHSDHYGGITRQWDLGTIYCSQPTANLVHSQLGVDWQYLHILPLNQPTQIRTNTNRRRSNNNSNNDDNDGGTWVTVTFMDANHCPGAVMILFQVGSRSILHVGDFRWNANVMTNCAPLRPYLRGDGSAAAGGGGGQPPQRRLDELYLDTTYCNPQYTLPSQADAIAAVVDYVVQEWKQAQRQKQTILFLFGAYTIGKERIYLAVAKRLQQKIYVDRRRYRILSQVLFLPDQGQEQQQNETMEMYFTTNPKESILWVVPLGHVNMKKLVSYTSVQINKSFSQQFQKVIGFRPTGWSLPKPKSKIATYKDGTPTDSRRSSRLLQPVTRGKVSSCSVPYSEHSSFPELVNCIQTLDPQKIIPTVSVSKSKEQIDLLLSHVVAAAAAAAGMGSNEL